MSFLTRGCRTRHVRFQWTPLISQPTRGAKKGPPKVERDDKGQVRKKKQKDASSVFYPLPQAQLNTPLLQPPKPSLKIRAFDAEKMSENMVGKTVAFEFSEQDPARKFGLPKKLLLEYRVLSKPYTVIRNVTLDVVGKLNQAEDSSSLDSRYVLTGRSGAGKSSVLLQAVEYCSQRKWVVIYIPRGVNLVNSSTPYAYDLRTQTYLQPQFAFQTLQRTLSVNSSILSSLHTTKKLFFEKRELPVRSSLTDLIAIGLKDASSAPAVLDALMTELGQQIKYPVLLAIDDFQALYCKTAYKDPFFTTIRPYHLSMPRLIMEFASGKRSLAKGAVLCATTDSDPAYPVPLELREALQIPYEHPQSPYDKRSTALVDYANGLTPIPVPEQLTLDEAASLFEAWKEEHVMAPVTYDELFLSKYTESSGNPREFVKGLLSTLST
ncbi:mitochondrial carrier protein [Amanita muscaria]